MDPSSAPPPFPADPVVVAIAELDRSRAAIVVLLPDEQIVMVEPAGRLEAEMLALEVALRRRPVFGRTELRVSALGAALLSGAARPGRMEKRIRAAQSALPTVRVTEIRSDDPLVQRAYQAAIVALAEAGA